MTSGQVIDVLSEENQQLLSLIRDLTVEGGAKKCTHTLSVYEQEARRLTKENELLRFKLQKNRDGGLVQLEPETFCG